MSSQHPGGPRRRRIAGERRGKAATPGEPLPLKSPGLPATAPAEPEGIEEPPAKPATRFRTRFAAKPVTEPAAKPVDKPAAKPVTKPAEKPAEKPVDKPATKTVMKPVTAPVVDEAGAPGSRRSGWWGSRASLMLLSGLLAALLVLAGLAALGVLGIDGVADVNEGEVVERATDTAPSAAETAAAAVLAYDHTSLEADLDGAVKFMTDDFAEEYSETFEKVVAPTAEDKQAKVTAAVRAAGVIRASEDTARVLLFVDQATVTAESERPRIALNRVVMTMVREGDRWLVDDISPY